MGRYPVSPRQYANGHPLKEIRQRLGPEVIEAGERLMYGLLYVGNPFTDAKEKAAAAQSAIDLHTRAVELTRRLFAATRS